MKIVVSCIVIVCALFVSCEHKRTVSADQLKMDAVSSIPEIEQLSRWIEGSPNQADLRFQRASLYYSIEQLKPATEDLLAAIQLDSTWLEPRHLLADVYLDNLQSRKALETMEETTRIFPDSIRSLLKLSEFQLILMQYQQAMQTVKQIFQLDANNPDAHFMSGMILKETGDTTNAIAQFQYATKENPWLIDAWINLGQLHEARGSADAVRYFDAGLSVSPNHPLLLHAKAQYLAKSSQTESAKMVYQKLIELDPFSAKAYYDLGLLYLDQDSTAKAQNHFELSLKIDPMFARAYFYRGWTNEILENYGAARNDYEQVLRLEKEDPDAEEGLARINSKF
jgi:tetratricopeptide (TPR) repeat protein